MRSRGRSSIEGEPPALRLAAWGFALLLLGSAFVPLSAGLTRALSWLACLYALFEALLSIGRGRKASFIAYAAAAVLMNPLAPFHFAPQAWRLIYAGIGLWIIADHLQGRE